MNEETNVKINKYAYNDYLIFCYLCCAAPDASVSFAVLLAMPEVQKELMPAKVQYLTRSGAPGPSTLQDVKVQHNSLSLPH